jgi:hypothetical protein
MIVIHIGLRKTGSTSIQQFLSVNEKILRGMGVDYSPVGQNQRNNHTNIFYELYRPHNFDPKYGTLSQAAEYWKEHPGKTFILSAEDFADLNPPEIASLRDALKSSDDDVRIIMVIRELIDLLPSEYSQWARGGLKIGSFDEFFAKRIERRKLLFSHTAELWADSFGWDSLHIRLLNRQHLANGDLTDEFLAITGLDPTDAGVRALNRPGVANASPGWRVLEAVRALYAGNHGLPVRHALGAPQDHNDAQRKIIGRSARKLGEKRGWNTDRGRYMTLRHAQQCLEIHGAAVVAMNTKLSQKLPEPLSLEARGFVEREFLPDASHIPAQELREFYDELAVRASRRRSSSDQV